MSDLIGWIATAVFASSYFFQKPAVLRRFQAFAALLWISYGILIQATPVIAANLIVGTLAIWSSFRKQDVLIPEEGLDKVEI